MGCCQSQNRTAPKAKSTIELPRQEVIIERGEASIPFSQKSAKELDTTFKAHGTSGRMSVPQLKKALGVLELDPQVFTDPDTQVYKFLDKLKNEKKLYDIQKLSLCSILLGTDDSKTKSRILFNHFDTDNSEKFDKTELKHMLNEMLEISLKLIPMISLKIEDDATQKPEDVLTEEEMKEYIDGLRRYSDTFVDLLLEKLLGDAESLSSDEFVNKVAGDKLLQRMLRSADIRVSLYELSKGISL